MFTASLQCMLQKPIKESKAKEVIYLMTSRSFSLLPPKLVLTVTLTASQAGPGYLIMLPVTAGSHSHEIG